MRFGQSVPVAMTAVVKEIVNPTTITIVRHGQILKARVLANMGVPSVGDMVLVGYLRDANEYYLFTGPGAPGPGVPCIEYNPPYPEPVPTSHLYFWASVYRSGNYRSIRRYRVSGDTLVSASPVTDLGAYIHAIRSPRWDPDTCIALTVSGDALSVHRTIDGGITWTVTWTLTGFTGRSVQQSSLWIDPNEPNHVYWGTYSANLGDPWLYASANGGLSFAYRSSGSAGGYYYGSVPGRSIGIRSIRRAPGGMLWCFHDPAVSSTTPVTRAANWLSTSNDDGSTFNNPYNGTWYESTRLDVAAGASSEGGLKFVGHSWGPGANGNQWTSLDGGATFPHMESVNMGSPGVGDSVDISILNDLVWFCRSDLQVHVGEHFPQLSGDNGDSWANMASLGDLLDSRGCYCDFLNQGTFWLVGINGAGEPYCMRSIDVGVTWVDITGGENMNRTSVSYGPGNA